MDSRSLARRALASRGWTLVGSPPEEPVVVLVCAPHTSNWDFPLMLLIAAAGGVKPRFLMKAEAFRGPARPVLKRLGGIPVDRGNAAGLVTDLVEHARSSEHFALTIAPEGTRKAGGHWKSGFYRIARDADIPIVLCFIDKPTATMGFGPTMNASGDLAADMDKIRAFYADKHGVVPENRSAPQLREEVAP
jgi:1-acyl-sn-glycerol-3-phosphate acyltransferase